MGLPCTHPLCPLGLTASLAKNPFERLPITPVRPWTTTTSRASSIFNFFFNRIWAKNDVIPIDTIIAFIPICLPNIKLTRMAYSGEMKPLAGVIPASPAIDPFNSST